MKVPAPVQFRQISSIKIAADKIAALLLQHGYQVFYVGGWVRDLLMNKPTDDIDIATNATPKELLDLFPQAIPVGVAFGVIRLIMDSQEFEIATFRKDGLYIDGRHPADIEMISSPEEDIQRRDFSINGLFYDPHSHMIYDYVGGIKDIQQRVIRTIGNPKERFSEDRLRILRAIRFKNRFSYSYDEETWKALVEMASDALLKISPERVFQEFDKMVKKKILGKCLKDILKTDLFYHIFPSLHSVAQDALDTRIELISVLSSIEYTPISTPILISLLFSPGQLLERLNFAQQFRLSNQAIRIITTVSQIESALHQGISSCEERRLVDILSLPYAIESLLYLEQISPYMYEESQKMKRVFQDLQFWIDQLLHHSFYISGRDLIEKGVAPGKSMGVLIEKAFLFSLQRREKDKNRIIDYIVHGD